MKLFTTEVPTFDEVSAGFNSTRASTVEDENTSLSSEVIVYISVGIFGVFANGFAAFIIATNKKMRKKVCNFFILNQSIIDLMGSFFMLVNNPAIVSQKQPSSWPVAQFYCRFWASSYFMWAMFEMSTFNLVAITIERYVEVVHPLSYHDIFTRPRAMACLAFVWVFGILFPMLPNVYPSPPGPAGICQRYGGWTKVLPLKVFGRVVIYVVLLLAPITIMIFCYTKMVFVIQRRVSPATEGNISAAEKAREERRMKARRNLIRTLINVCLAFFLCWVFNLTYSFLSASGVDLGFKSTFYHLTVYLTFVNCVINPIIYTAQYREFQNAVKARVPCFQHLSGDNQNEVTTTIS